MLFVITVILVIKLDPKLKIKIKKVFSYNNFMVVSHEVVYLYFLLVFVLSQMERFPGTLVFPVSP